MADAASLEEDAVNFAKLAVQHDEHEKYDVAVFYYTEAAQALLGASMAGSKHGNLIQKANEYILRAEDLKKLSAQQTRSTVGQEPPTAQVEMERAKYFLMEALEMDESGNIEDAVKLYTQAVEFCLKLKSSTPDKNIQTKVGELALQALDRAEKLKGIPAPLPNQRSRTSGSSQMTTGPRVGPLGINPFAEDRSPGPERRPVAGANGPQPGPPTGGGGSYTPEELQVLKSTSTINTRKYVPFLDIDVREKFAFLEPFKDKDGLLALSDKQKRHFARWVRPVDYLTEPQMIMAISSLSIRQTIVTDCSFVASMAIAAQYERRFKKKLVTNIIYPQNRKGEAVYNPCGKYIVKLNINGVPRKVIIDDFLPMDRQGELLCSFSSNRDELWVSLLEKAYLKVMGGYDFPGSNSNIDLHALTGWIPERVAIRLGTVQFNKDKEFRKLLDRFHRGDCLVTMATGELPDAEENRTGLVATHAYAMLDVREVLGHRLMMLKNPWSHLRWKGKFSERDSSWTPELLKALNYDVANAQQVDNGVFWIDYDSLCNFYDVIYINWNPALFSSTTCIHSTWHAREGPKKDAYNISDNPQYRLTVRATSSCPVWILLTRHITDKADFANNREFIALVVYKDVKSRKVFYPSDPLPYRDGVRINSPHCLVKLVQEKGVQEYILVVSQYEKNNTINYTLRTYCNCDFSLTKIIDPYKTEKQVTGQWKGATAGGCGNNRATYSNNPCFQVKLENNNVDNMLMIEMKGPREYAVGFEIVTVSANNTQASGSFEKKSSGDFRRGYVVAEFANFSGGIYNIIPSTYNPGQEAPFILTLSSLRPFSLSQIR